MLNEHNKRRYERAKGPYSGRHLGPCKTHVLINDLSLGGGFVRFTGEQPEGSTLRLKVKLPAEGPVILTAEKVYSHEAGWPVRFVDVTVDSAVRLARTVDAAKQRAVTRPDGNSLRSW